MSKIAFLFPGQGVQHIGMGKEIIENFNVAKSLIDEISEYSNINLKNLLFSGSIDELNKIKNTQISIFSVSLACFKVLKEIGITPEVNAGFSLGEYTALTASEVFDLKTAVEILEIRGRLLSETFSNSQYGMMAVLGMSKEKIEEIINKLDVGFVAIANINCPQQIVIAGEKVALEDASKELINNGAKRVLALSVQGAFHTSLLENASEKLKEELNKFKINRPKIPIIANETGDYIEDDIINSLKNQLKSPVLWEQSINKLIKEGFDTFIEVGPGKVLSGFVRKINSEVKVVSVEDIKSLEKTCEILGVSKC